MVTSKEEKEDALLVLKKKAETYHKEKDPVHITFRKDGSWENGYIISEPTADFFKLEYLKAGKDKHQRDGDFIFFLELNNIEEYSEMGKWIINVWKEV